MRSYRFNTVKKGLICFFVLLYCSIGHTQKNYRMESITVTDGLSQGFVLSLFEDSRGFIWIGTFNGLNRYDGYQVKRFTPDKSTPGALKTNYIFCIKEDSTGLLWLGTDKGLVVMDPYTEQFVHLIDIDTAFTAQEVISIDIKEGRVWVSDREAKVGGETLSQTYVVTPSAHLTSLIRGTRDYRNAFSIKSIAFPAGLIGPVHWLQTSDPSEILFADHQVQFCKINPASLQVEIVDFRTIGYRRMGNYGLVYRSREHTGFIFQLPENIDNKQAVKHLADFIQIPGQMPILHQVGDSILYQFDTISGPKNYVSSDNKPFYKYFKPSITLDRSVSFQGIVDRNGSLWMSTNGYGVRKFRPKKLGFQHYLPNRGFYNFKFLPNGRIWPGRDIPKEVFNPTSNQLEAAPWASVPMSRVYNLIISGSGDYWLVASRDDRLYILNRKAGNDQWTIIPIELSFYAYCAVQLLEDRNGNIWVSGTKGEIARIRPDNMHIDRWQFGQFFPKKQRELLQSTCLLEGKDGNLWLGSNQGLVRITHPEETPRFEVWHNHSDKGVLFKNDRILSLCPDPDNLNLIWVGTYGGGLHLFDSQKGSSEIFTEKDGLINNVVYGILPDAFGYLWLSTNRGLSRFNRQNRTFYNFIHEDPKLDIEFNTDASHLMPSGELAFGSVNGLFIIRPMVQPILHRSIQVAITEIKINGAVLNNATENTYFNVNAKNEISLQIPFEKNSIIFEFAALQTSDPASAQFRYRMLGLHQHWIHAGLQRTANFALIPPGQYTLELQSISSDGNWADAPITKVSITIIPPWYRSRLAWILYAGLFLLLVFAYIRYERRHLQLKYAEKINEKEIQRLQSLDDFKNRFFGYISHEFKTPLTIILGQARRIETEKNHQNMVRNAGAIHQQGQSMLEMVTQMVDITRLDRKEIKLNWRNGDISGYVRFLVESLRSLAEFKDIKLDFQTAIPVLMMDFDPLRLKFIVNNLLSNAIRHTPPGGHIGISISADAQNQMLLEVSDTGEGIAPEDLPKIFERYYQGTSNDPQQQEPHFGIGLTFVKDLVELFGGEISVSSQLGIGSRFVIALPVTQTAPAIDTFLPEVARMSDHLTGELSDTAADKPLPLLLIVEDNLFISNFIQYALEPYFSIEFARDGLSGYEKALKIVPDLILTDVMMPGIDGYELTNRLKSHELTNHIPIVMLSARSELSDRLTGQQHGANAYLGKPFDEQELILTLKNLYQLQGQWRKRYATITTPADLLNDSAKGSLEHTEESVTQPDAFMLKIYTIFEKNYSNEEYSLPHFCRDIEMSKSQLQRKLTALSDLTSMELLRRYRLQKAYEILSEQPNLNVKEVCFMVGFKDPAHFSRLFSKMFQVAPSGIKKV